MDDGLRASLKDGGRWIWFAIATFLWSIGIRIAFFVAVLPFLIVPAAAYGGAAAVFGDLVGGVIGLVALVLTPVLLGAVGRRTGIGYPKVAVDLSFVSPADGDDGSPGTTQPAGDRVNHDTTD